MRSCVGTWIAAGMVVMAGTSHHQAFPLEIDSHACAAQLTEHAQGIIGVAPQASERFHNELVNLPGAAGLHQRLFVGVDPDRACIWRGAEAGVNRYAQRIRESECVVHDSASFRFDVAANGATQGYHHGGSKSSDLCRSYERNIFMAESGSAGSSVR